MSGDIQIRVTTLRRDYYTLTGITPAETAERLPLLLTPGKRSDTRGIPCADILNPGGVAPTCIIQEGLLYFHHTGGVVPTTSCHPGGCHAIPSHPDGMLIPADC